MPAETIDFIDLYGEAIAIEKSRISFRPSVYGIILHEGSVLVCNTKSTRKYSLPGGGIDLGEKIEEALRREVREECGIAIEIEQFIDFQERFFYYNPADNAWQIHAFFFLCRPLSFDLVCHDDSDEAEAPRWVKIDQIRAEDFQAFGDVVVNSVARLRIIPRNPEGSEVGDGEGEEVLGSC